MDLTFAVQTRIEKPVQDVFLAVIDPALLCRYFTNESSGSLEEGKSVVWKWNHYGEVGVRVKRVIPNEKIVFEWGASKGDYDTKATLTFSSADSGGTTLHIEESGWQESNNGLDAAYENLQGWTHFYCCLKAYLEHGIDLRSN